MKPLLCALVRQCIANQLRAWCSVPSLWFASFWPSRLSLSLVRWMCQIQISAEQLALIVKTVKATPHCRFLVFGLGHDSVLWHRINRHGLTIFLEDDAQWIRHVLTAYPYLHAFQVGYETTLSDWTYLIDTPERLQMTLPAAVRQREWDVILVDAPAGRGDQFPGRMKSIFAAAALVTRGGADGGFPGGDIFVHDCERPVERAYCDRWLTPQHFVRELVYTEGWLRQYRL